MNEWLKPKIAVQLFTLRDYTKTASGLEDSLARVRDIGYRAVQVSYVQALAGPNPELTASKARQLLDRYGLRCIATHRAWNDLSENTAAEIEFHRTLGCDYIAVGEMPRPWQHEGPAGVRRFIEHARPVIDKLKEAGIRFGYHNHDREFIHASPGGGTLFDILIEEGGEDLLLELDLYWVAHAGVNPERLVERCHGRLPVIHVKDKEVLEQRLAVIAPVGEGNLDWEHLLPACEIAGTEWYTVEQDICRRDPFNCLASSYQYLADLSSRLPHPIASAQLS